MCSELRITNSEPIGRGGYGFVCEGELLVKVREITPDSDTGGNILRNIVGQFVLSFPCPWFRLLPYIIVFCLPLMSLPYTSYIVVVHSHYYMPLYSLLAHRWHTGYWSLAAGWREQASGCEGVSVYGISRGHTGLLRGGTAGDIQTTGEPLSRIQVGH